MISIIIPVRNEENCIEGTLKQLQSLGCKVEREIIVVDGGSTDNTAKICKAYARVVTSPRGKSLQLNSGVKNSKGDVLFFVHADMYVPDGSLSKISEQINKGYDGGGFANVFDRHNEKIKNLGHLLNFRFFKRLESPDKGIFFGDNGIFVKRTVYDKIGGFKNIPIMEDYDFSVKLKKNFRVNTIQEPKLILSARRHEKVGFIKTRLQWIIIRKLYNLGVSPFWLARLYADVR